MKKLTILAVASVAVLTGCAGSKDYAPAAGASGTQMFKDACVGCHGPISDKELTTFWEIAQENANAAYVAAKIGSGSLMMPSFPNIKGAELETLSKFVLEHNKSK